jgi:queuosine precursor transporter
MIWLVAYIGTIFAANWALSTFGVLPVGGLLIPAGTLFAGLAFTLRDLTQRVLGPRVVILAILAGAGVSALVSPRFAAASGIAFLVSEGLDFFVYTPLERRHWLGAVALSNTVGLVADSLLFLGLAFSSLAFLPGQLVGKAAMTVLALPVLWAISRRMGVVGEA